MEDRGMEYQPRSPDEIESALTGISVRRIRFSRAVTNAVERIFGPLYRHWLAVLNSSLAIFIGLSALGPVLYAFGMAGPANGIFNAYRLICGQVPSHSFYIAGYQMCLCSRCLAIYSSLLAGGLFLALHRRYPLFAVRPITWKWWALGMLPMALDGGTQLIGWHESNVYLRLLTGAIFGLMTAWYLLPQIEGPAYTSSPEPSAQLASSAVSDPD